ncbi:cupin domain-containing protein [Ruania albidiflava]|uniref:cupin domain-containing protein n=1 Tax=Ruania albidiflava TaxID=366586 RepID=UPI00040958B5|nr:cupin domain-containing protein [Ruania albidiflava]TMZ53071.1 LuxR family transcriptional regulator [Klebsiella pneumoniae]
MRKPSLDAMARQLGERAARASSGRAAETVYGGHEKRLRQTIVAMTAGTELAEHENPGDATVLVIHGRLKLLAGDVSWEGRQGDFLTVPDERHSIEAVTETAFLLSVAKH